MPRYLLDTVTVSELRRDKGKMHPGVWRWQSGIGDVWLSVITLNEIRYGMRKVERKDPDFAARLAAWYATIVAQPQRFRILGVDRAIAEQAADYRAAHGTSTEDSLIAATAKVHRLTLATRNTADFAATGIQLVNPWEHPA
ncbi:MAG TPA: type II toxin-antitoxin system VapC family toxin [Bacteroidia bacterium]|nr:type II toxin-antitoxin system VapC family toxin [Bacteroidia bacterium]